MRKEHQQPLHVDRHMYHVDRHIYNVDRHSTVELVHNVNFERVLIVDHALATLNSRVVADFQRTFLNSIESSALIPFRCYGGHLQLTDKGRFSVTANQQATLTQVRYQNFNQEDTVSTRQRVHRTRTAHVEICGTRKLATHSSRIVLVHASGLGAASQSLVYRRFDCQILK